MEIIDAIIDIALTAILVIGCFIAGCKFMNTYEKAQSFNNLTDIEKGILTIADKDRYEDLHNSYCFIIDLPLIGETL